MFSKFKGLFSGPQPPAASGSAKASPDLAPAPAPAPAKVRFVWEPENNVLYTQFKILLFLLQRVLDCSAKFSKPSYCSSACASNGSSQDWNQAWPQKIKALHPACDTASLVTFVSAPLLLHPFSLLSGLANKKNQMKLFHYADLIEIARYPTGTFEFYLSRT